MLIVNGRPITSLIDTGASHSVIPSSEVTTNKYVNLAKNITIHGLGNSKCKCKGNIKLNTEYVGVIMPHNFAIATDKDLNHPIILGMDYLRTNNIIVNLTNNKISKRNEDKSITDVYLDEAGNIKHKIHECLPVYCKENLVIKHNETIMIPITLNRKCTSKINEINLMHFESNNQNKNLEVMEGVMDINHENLFILSKLKNKLKQTVKKNEILGRISKVITTDEVEEEINCDIHRITKEIKLSDNLDRSEKKLVHEMLMNTKL